MGSRFDAGAGGGARCLGLGRAASRQSMSRRHLCRHTGVMVASWGMWSHHRMLCEMATVAPILCLLSVVVMATLDSLSDVRHVRHARTATLSFFVRHVRGLAGGRYTYSQCGEGMHSALQATDVADSCCNACELGRAGNLSAIIGRYCSNMIKAQNTKEVKVENNSPLLCPYFFFCFFSYFSHSSSSARKQ